MKLPSAICFLAVLLSIPCIGLTQVQPAKPPSNSNMRGSYIMFRQTINTGRGDSLLAVHQLKLFTDKFVMYAHRRSQDSLADFAIGTYEVKNGKVIERIFYDNNGPQNLSYELNVVRDGSGYTQVVNFPASGQMAASVLTEDYKKFGRKMRSPLDGAWQQVKTISVSPDGKITTNDNPTQFKVFEAGNFIWANTEKDSLSGQYTARYGFGTFEMKNARQAAEINLSSTYASALVGKPVILDLNFPGKDLYEQTITYPDGSKYTEVYKRLQ